MYNYTVTITLSFLILRVPQLLERLVNSYVTQKKFAEGKGFLNPIIDQFYVIGADESAMKLAKQLMEKIDSR